MSNLRLQLQKGLVGHWTMNSSDTNGGVLYDKSANGNHASLETPVVTGVDSPVGDGFSFSGDRLRSLNVEDIGSSSFAFSFWLRGDFSNSSKTYPDVFDGFWGRSNDDSGFRFDSDSTNRYIQAFKYPNKFTEWTHISCTVDQTIGEAYFYQDAQLIFTDTFSAGENIPDSISFFGNDDLYIDISDFRYYKRYLSESEINALYQMRSERYSNV